ncbi:hypothetical protein ACLOJK_041510 [Asimina triloba]
MSSLCYWIAIGFQVVAMIEGPLLISLLMALIRLAADSFRYWPDRGFHLAAVILGFFSDYWNRTEGGWISTHANMRLPTRREVADVEEEAPSFYAFAEAIAAMDGEHC